MRDPEGTTPEPGDMPDGPLEVGHDPWDLPVLPIERGTPRELRLRVVP